MNSKITKSQDCIGFNSKCHQWYLSDSLPNIVQFVADNADPSRHYDSMTEILYTTLPSFYLLDHKDQRLLIIASSENQTLCDLLIRTSPYQFHLKPWIDWIRK